MYFILILLTASAQVCPSITCGLLSYPICEKSTVPSRNISSCLPNQYCNRVPTAGTSYCAPLPNNRYAGDLCSLDSQCLSGFCDSGFCTGPSYKDVCTIIGGCGVGLYCDGSLCQNQIKPGGQCTQDYQCSNNAFCNLGICTEYWSLAVGEKVEAPQNGLSLGCKTAAAVLFGSDWVCASSEPSNTLGASCVLGSSCYSAGAGYSQPCVCGNNPYGQAYCPLFPGDPQVHSTIQFAQQVFLNNSICNTNSRFSLNCFLAYPQLLEDFLYFATNYSLSFQGLFAVTYNSSNCILQSLNTDFYNLLNALKQIDGYQPCDPYYCPNQFNALEPNQCILAVNDSNFGVLSNIKYANSICDWNYSCIQKTPESNGTCELLEYSPGNPGDFCNETFPCNSGRCLEGLCLGIRENEICKNPSDCQPGFFCNQQSKLCQKLKSKGMSCNHNYECSTYLLCNLGTCINYFSLNNKENTDVYKDGYSFACSSGFAAQSSTGDVYTCAPAPVSGKTNTCKYRNQPCYDSTKTYSNNCSCSMAQIINGVNSVFYCPPFAGDIYFQNVIVNLQYLLNWNQVCNTLSRLHERCFMRSDEYLGYYYFYATNLSMFVNYSSIYSVQPCILKTFEFTEYTQQKSLIAWVKNHSKSHNNNDDSFAGILKSVTGVLFLAYNLVL